MPGGNGGYGWRAAQDALRSLPKERLQAIASDPRLLEAELARHGVDINSLSADERRQLQNEVSGQLNAI